MASIQDVYVALFGRPADPTGLSYFNGVTSNGADLSKIGDLASTDEYKARFKDMSNAQIINSIYLSLFGRQPEAAGLTFFSDALASGKLNIKNIAIGILDGAQGTDKTTAENKVKAADLYTKSLDTGPEMVAYTGSAAAAAGVAFLAGVTDTVPKQTEVDAAVLSMVGGSGAGGTGTPGLTFTLTANADSINPTSAESKFKSTDGNDTFRGVIAGDLGTVDALDGGKGTDTLNAKMAVANGTVVAPVLASIEKVNLDYSAGAIGAEVKFDAGSSTGIEKLVADGIKIDVDTNTFIVDNITNSSVVQFSKITVDDDAVAGANATGNVKVVFKDTSGGSDAGTVSFAGVKLGVGDKLVLTASGIETLTINSTGTAANAADFNKVSIIDAEATKLIITGDRDYTAVAGTLTALKTVDASALTAKLTYTATDNGETISGGSKGDAITLGNGSDVVVYKAENASTISNQDTINNFSFTADKVDLKAFKFAANSTIGSTAVVAAGDIKEFFGTNSFLVGTGAAADLVYVDANKDGNFDAGTDLVIKIIGATPANFTVADLTLA